jgi:hypothetical protein
MMRDLPINTLAATLAIAVLASFLLDASADPGDENRQVRGSSPLLSEADRVVTVPGAVDPHGAAGQCGECHGLSPAGEVLDRSPAMSACERCHPDTNFHLVGVAAEEVTVPEVMILPGGEITCATCHDEPACDGLPRDARGEHHFRDGPYPAPMDLCFQCHDRESYQQTDPHRDLRAADGQRNDAVCVFCHQGVPESEQDESIEVLRVDPVELCKGCHAHQIHVGIPSHLEIAPEGMIERLGAYNGATDLPMPLGPAGEITCTTCHDPHPGLEPLPTGTAPAKLDGLRRSNRDYRDTYYLPRLHDELSQIRDVDGKALDLQDGPRSKDGLLRVPAEDGTLCLICHDLEGK